MEGGFAGEERCSIVRNGTKEGKNARMLKVHLLDRHLVFKANYEMKLMTTIMILMTCCSVAVSSLGKLACSMKGVAGCAVISPAGSLMYGACQVTAFKACAILNPGGPLCYSTCQAAAAASCASFVGPAFVPCYAAGQAACVGLCGSAGWTSFTTCYAAGQATCAAGLGMTAFGVCAAPALKQCV